MSFEHFSVMIIKHNSNTLEIFGIEVVTILILIMEEMIVKETRWKIRLAQEEDS